MKKYYLYSLLLVVLLIVTGCNGKNNVSNLSSGDTATNERFPSFVVETATASNGEKDVVVRVSLKDNPGFLTMAMTIDYDSDNMSLTKVLSGTDYGEYNFVGPKNKKSGCIASWFVPEIPETIVDGTILELHFDINKSAKKGSYPISISRSANGGVVDQNKQEIIFNNATGYIKVK